MKIWHDYSFKLNNCSTFMIKLWKYLNICKKLFFKCQNSRNSFKKYEFWIWFLKEKTRWFADHLSLIYGHMLESKSFRKNHHVLWKSSRSPADSAGFLESDIQKTEDWVTSVLKAETRCMSAASYPEVLLFEDERRHQLAPLLGEIHLDEPVSLLPGRLPETSVWLSNDDEPLLRDDSKTSTSLCWNTTAKKKIQPSRTTFGFPWNLFHMDQGSTTWKSTDTCGSFVPPCGPLAFKNPNNFINQWMCKFGEFGEVYSLIFSWNFQNVR